MKYYFIIIFILLPTVLSAQIITTWAGEGRGGGIDGLGDGLSKDSSIFTNPANSFFDKYGNFYFGDIVDQRVRIIDTIGNINSLAGNGYTGYNGDGGLADTSELNGPVSVITDSVNNVYIADNVNYRIRKIDHITGIISTIAGNGVSGFSGDNGLAINAQFSMLSDIWFDKNGDLLITDNSRVRKINRSGIILTIAGNGSFTSTVNGGLADTSAIGGATGVCTDSNNNIYIADVSNTKIYKINNLGAISIVAGTNAGYLYNGDNIPAINAAVIPNKVRVDPKTNNLFFVDLSPNNRIRMIDSAGIIHTAAGNGTNSYTGDNGLAELSGIPNPGGLSFDNCSNLYISQVGHPARLRKVTYDTSCYIHAAQHVGVNNVTPVGVKIYPNPTYNVITIEIQITMEYRLMNIMGCVLQTGVLKAGKNNIGLEGMISGVYLLELNSTEGRTVRKVLKQ
ncbi:MAG: T9SS type A sorting domain-containing protein [Flavipsychrobacter sp.]|nr:T9SS type A sorting domain-containing protein [Flavipsychrobacter sp.]